MNLSTYILVFLCILLVEATGLEKEDCRKFVRRSIQLGEEPVPEYSISYAVCNATAVLTNLPMNLDDDADELKIVEDQLDTTKAPLRKLFANVFSTLSSLINLDATELRIAVLEPGAFEGLINLRKLYLHGNKLRTLPDKVFDDMPKLYYLGLSHNELEVIEESTFNNMSNLHTLDLSNNAITALNGEWSFGVAYLKHLNLARNKLSTLRFGMFGSLFGVELLLLEGNKIDYVETESFGGLFALRWLDLTDNVNITGTDMIYEINEFMPALKVIYLSPENFECKQLMALTAALKLKEINVESQFSRILSMDKCWGKY